MEASGQDIEGAGRSARSRGGGVESAGVVQLTVVNVISLCLKAGIGHTEGADESPGLPACPVRLVPWIQRRQLVPARRDDRPPVSGTLAIDEGIGTCTRRCCA